MKFDKELDARGMACPMPVVKTKKTLSGMTDGQILKVVATDTGALADMQAFAENTGHELLASETVGAEFVFYLKK